jgi:hypothetical protein
MIGAEVSQFLSLTKASSQLPADATIILCQLTTKKKLFHNFQSIQKYYPLLEGYSRA